jgi:hypothetical protein
LSNWQAHVKGNSAMIVQRATTHEHEANKSIVFNVKFDDDDGLEQVFKKCFKCTSLFFRVFPRTDGDGKIYVRGYDNCVINEKTRQEDCIGFIDEPKGLI